MKRIYLHLPLPRSEASLRFADLHEFDVFDTSVDDFEPARVIQMCWGEDDLIIMETDMVPTIKQLIELEACQSPVCASLYYGFHGGLFYDMAGQKRVVDDKAALVRIDKLGCSVDYADFAGTGFCKISLPVQKLISPKVFDNYHWNRGLDVLLSDEILKLNLRWHLHKSFVKHNHFEMIK